MKTHFPIKRIYFIVIIFSALFLLSCKKGKSTSENIPIKKDSVAQWIKESKIKSNSTSAKKEFLNKAYNASVLEKNYSEANQNLIDISYQAINVGDTLLFKKASERAFRLSNKLKDTSNLAEIHWNYAIFFSEIEKLDSTYYHYNKANKYYEQVGDTIKAARMLYNMAVVQKNVGDYTGSEITSYKAIPKFHKRDYLKLYRCYNNLGVVYTNLKEYEEAINHHKKAFNYLNKLENVERKKQASLNNIGLVYQKKGDYNMSMDYFLKAINSDDSLYYKKPEFYARLNDNLYYTKFLKGDTIEVEEELLRTLRLRDSLKDYSGIVINKLHLSEFFLKRNDTLLAEKNAKEAYSLAKEKNNNRDVLESLLLLSKIEKEDSEKYLHRYIELNRTLQEKERKLRNKTTRIRYNTEEYKEEIKSLSSQQKYIIVIALAIILISILLYINRHQRAKNKELTFEREQQLANEEIYQLMLRQQTKLEEGRLKERHRISEELHDGVLGKIFGTRMGLGFLGFKGNPEEKDKHQNYIDELQEIEKEIRIISHELKNEILGTNVDYIKIVEDLVEEQSKISIFKYSIVQDGDIQWSAISDIIKINIYRVVQEALQNINKHANANSVSIEFSSVADQIKVIIEDDGVGFDQVKKANGIGLKNITSRVTKLKGTFTIESKPDNGTVLTICVPI